VATSRSSNASRFADVLDVLDASDGYDTRITRSGSSAQDGRPEVELVVGDRLEISIAFEHAAGGSSLDSAVSQASSDFHRSERLNLGHCGR
jgi:hypothetical protein